MMKILLTLGFGLLVAGAAFAGGGDYNDMPQQQVAMPQTKVVVVQPEGDNTAAYVTAGAVIVAAGIGYLGVRKNRKG